MNIEDLQPNMMLNGPKWNSPVTLESVTPQNDRIKLVFRRDDGSLSSMLIRHADLENIQKHETPYGIPWRAKAAVEMLRHKYAQSGIVGQGEMDPLPHQIQSIYHITGQHGDVRFMLADEPGAGKTAVAASIIHEMQLQGRRRPHSCCSPGAPQISVEGRVGTVCRPQKLHSGRRQRQQNRSVAIRLIWYFDYINGLRQDGKQPRNTQTHEV